MAVALVLAVGSLSLFAPQSAEAATPAWWNAGYLQRAQTTVETIDATPAGYTLSITIPHSSWVASGLSLAGGNDVRVTYWNGSAWIELDRVLDPHTSWNTNGTKLWFRSQAGMSASSTDTNYWVYYGNPSAGSPPANGNNVFDLWDDFSSGSVDPAKWNVWAVPGGGSTVSNGELVVTGTTDPATWWNYSGLETVAGFNVGYHSAADFSIVSQSANAHEHWKLGVGPADDVISVASTNSPDKQVSYYNGSGWTDVGDSTLDGQTFGYQHVASAVDPAGTALWWENSSLKGTHSGTPTWGSNLYFMYAPNDDANETFEVRFDNVMIRKYVTNEPTASLTSVEVPPAEVEVSVTIAPELTFAVIGRPAATSCNGAASDTASNASDVLLGSPTVLSNVTAAQDLHVVTNAENGFTVTVRYTGPLSSGSHTLTDWSGTNASPTSWTTPGTEAIGYTSDGLSRFTSGGTKWAGLSTTASPVAASAGPADSTTCLAYRAGASATTAAGHYSTSIVINAIANF
jgi:hypothetical protein